MGMFDSVMFACPGDETHPELEVQSKARDWPGLVNFPQDEVPYMIAADIEGDEVYCESCCRTYIVSRKIDPPPPAVAMKLVYPAGGNGDWYP